MGATSPLSSQFAGSALSQAVDGAIGGVDGLERDRAQVVVNSKLKRCSDILLAVVGLTALGPIFAAIALAVVLDSGGPVFYGQRRIAFDRRQGPRRDPRERTFTCWKFRTMVPGAEELRERIAFQNAAPFPAFKVHGDPRVTRVGRFLRKSSLDELPQLWNVVRGEMSLVGPRPPLPQEVANYDDYALQRLAVRPGLTCLWQIGPRHHDDSTFRDWVQQDLEYIRSWSLMKDLVVLCKTVFVVAKMTGD